jgi:hypothetical protein
MSWLRGLFEIKSLHMKSVSSFSTIGSNLFFINIALQNHAFSCIVRNWK